jgi:hypothetical protein
MQPLHDPATQNHRQGALQVTMSCTSWTNNIKVILNVVLFHFDDLKNSFYVYMNITKIVLAKRFKGFFMYRIFVIITY